jgi:energy-coupling factor transporter ATP-binding protein EcfA2
MSHPSAGADVPSGPGEDRAIAPADGPGSAEQLAAGVRAAAASLHALLLLAPAPAAVVDVHKIQTPLAELAERIAAAEAVVAFAGHFSSGKSTLLNSLLGLHLLPTDDLPETGVACYIRAGDRAMAVVRDSHSEPVPLEPARLADVVRTASGNGQARPGLDTIDRVEVSLDGGRVPPGAVFVDTPGINETTMATVRARQALDQADLVCFVVNSRQPLGVIEQRFLDDLWDRLGDQGVVVVVNAYLREDTAPVWEHYLETTGARVRHRVAEALGADPVDTVVVSARALHHDPATFGGPELRALLGELPARAAASRAHRAGREIRPCLHDLVAAIASEEQRLGEAHDALAAATAQWEGRLAEARQAVATVSAECFARHLGTIDNLVATTSFNTPGHAASVPVIASMMHSISWYCERLADELLMALYVRLAPPPGLLSPGSPLHASLRRLLAPATVPPAWPAQHLSAAWAVAVAGGSARDVVARIQPVVVEIVTAAWAARVLGDRPAVPDERFHRGLIEVEQQLRALALTNDWSL